MQTNSSFETFDLIHLFPTFQEKLLTDSPIWNQYDCNLAVVNAFKIQFPPVLLLPI